MSAFVTRDAERIVIPWRSDLAQIAPHAVDFTHKGSRFLVLPNGQEEARLCRNLGLSIPSPIFTQYNWRGTTPWEIQKITAALLVESPRCYVLSTMGTGKTRSAVFGADFLMRKQRAKRALITAPLSTLTPVWEAELFKVMPTRRVRVLYGERKKRLALLKEDADFYIINHHGLHMLQDELIKRGFDIFVIDELAVLRNRSTLPWKAAHRMIESGIKYVWGMTGSPTPKAPTDAWGQIRLLTPARTTRTMTQFQDQTMRRVSDFKWIPRPEANQIVHDAMQPSVRYTRDDIAELPPTSYIDREVKLDPDAGKYYREMYNRLRIMTEKGSITAVNEGVLTNKLMQVACGYIYTDDGKVYELPSTNRRNALEEVLEETDRKWIVFCPYKHALDGVSRFLKDKDHDVVVISGDTPRGVRDRVFTTFQNSPRIRGIVAHPQTMAHGLTLTEANLIVWYAPTHSLEIYEQANARIVRPGQTSKTLIAHLYGTPVERAAYARLRTRAKLQGLLLELFKQQEIVF